MKKFQNRGITELTTKAFRGGKSSSKDQMPRTELLNSNAGNEKIKRVWQKDISKEWGILARPKSLITGEGRHTHNFVPTILS